MARNSKREQIILTTVAELEELSSIKTVIRKLPSYQDLQQYAITQLPVIAVVARLPKPEPHRLERVPAGRDIFISNLRIELYCYFQDNVNPDSTLSSILDDVWAKLYTDTTKGGLVIQTDLEPEINQDFWDPYYAFKLDINFKYQHAKGGI